jgi:hypothetical protein
MFKRLKRALVESYVGAIALGWILAQIVTHFVGIFSAPVGSWVSQNTYRNMTKTIGSTGFPFEAAYPELIRAALLLVVWYALLRWLYFKPLNLNSSETAPVAAPPVSGT